MTPTGGDGPAAILEGDDIPKLVRYRDNEISVRYLTHNISGLGEHPKYTTEGSWWTKAKVHQSRGQALVFGG